MRKESVKRGPDDLRREYDLARLKGGVRGKYYKQATAGTNLVLLDPGRNPRALRGHRPKLVAEAWNSDRQSRLAPFEDRSAHDVDGGRS
jgi:hypothetical protein